MPNPVDLSDNIPDDPTDTISLIEQLETDLLKAVAQYREQVLAALEEAAVKKKQEVSRPTIDINSYSAAIAATASRVKIENRKIIEQRTKEGYLKGIKFSQQGLHPYKITVAYNLPYDKSVIEALQARNTGAFSGVTNDMGKEIIRSVSEGAINGETVKQLSARVEVAVDGIGPARAETIARTELMKSVNTAVRLRYESSGVTKMRRMETKDERTCTDWEFNVGGKIYLGCKAIDGQVFTLEEAAEIDMQTHPNCRGTFVPVIEGLNPKLVPGGVPA